MDNPHEPFQTLGPIEWDDVAQDNIKSFLDEVFAGAQTVIESIPSPTTTAAAPTGRARSKTESAVLMDMQRSVSHRQSGASLGIAQQLRKEWKEIKVNARDNPLDINVYKLAAKDGKGSWFARRSVHEGLSFDQWKVGLEKEFPETMKIQGSPGSGNIRGIGADRRVENQVVDGTGHLNVFQLSAQFPGPTSPRDFITLLLTSDFSPKPTGTTSPLRQYIIVSKPCIHSDCPPRQGIIRGQYESVELIREIPLEVEGLASKRSLSSADLGADEKRRLNSEIREGRPVAIEWLMVTRSDPGGSVPRFLIEKGTPPGIVGDAGKFINWITANAAESSSTPEDDVHTPMETTGEGKEEPLHSLKVQSVPRISTPNHQEQYQEDDQDVPSSNGLYGIIAGVFETASYVVTTGLRQFGGLDPSQDSQGSVQAENEVIEDGIKEEEEEDEKENSDDLSSETSSIRSFTSALEKRMTTEKKLQTESLNESHSDESKSFGSQPFDKELKRLQEKRRKLDEKTSQMQERMEGRKRDGKDKDTAQLLKIREKHEKELAKQEAKFKREMEKLEEKRGQEERKAEARRRKALEKEEKSNLTIELEKVKAERDIALKRMQMLQNQVGELQAQNTMLVAKLGRMGGITRTDSTLSKTSGDSSNKSASQQS